MPIKIGLVFSSGAPAYSSNLSVLKQQNLFPTGLELKRVMTKVQNVVKIIVVYFALML